VVPLFTRAKALFNSPMFAGLKACASTAFGLKPESKSKTSLFGTTEVMP